MNITDRTAPKQEALIRLTHNLLMQRDDEVPEDGFDRIDYRMGIVLGGSYDKPDPEEPDMAVRDLLTDVLHYCHANGWDFFDVLERAQWMAMQEQREWDQREADRDGD
jgi:hypothetical protein